MNKRVLALALIFLFSNEAVADDKALIDKLAKLTEKIQELNKKLDMMNSFQIMIGCKSFGEFPASALLTKGSDRSRTLDVQFPDKFINDPSVFVAIKSVRFSEVQNLGNEISISVSADTPKRDRVQLHVLYWTPHTDQNTVFNQAPRNGEISWFAIAPISGPELSQVKQLLYSEPCL